MCSDRPYPLQLSVSLLNMFEYRHGADSSFTRSLLHCLVSAWGNWFFTFLLLHRPYSARSHSITYSTDDWEKPSCFFPICYHHFILTLSVQIIISLGQSHFEYFNEVICGIWFTQGVSYFTEGARGEFRWTIECWQ